MNIHANSSTPRWLDMPGNLDFVFRCIVAYSLTWIHRMVDLFANAMIDSLLLLRHTSKNGTARGITFPCCFCIWRAFFSPEIYWVEHQIKRIGSMKTQLNCTTCSMLFYVIHDIANFIPCMRTHQHMQLQLPHRSFIVSVVFAAFAKTKQPS